MNLAHLDPDVADVALEGRATRLAFLETGVGFIEWPGAMLIMDQALARAEERGSQLPHLLVIAPPKAGLGAILREIEHRTSSRNQLRRHAVLVRTPADFTPGRFMRVLSEALATPGLWRHSLERQYGQALRTAEELQTRLLMVRGLHHVSKPARARYLALLHQISDEGDVRLLLTTLSYNRKALDQWPELRASTTTLKLPAWPIDMATIDVVRSALRRYPLRRPTEVTAGFMDVIFKRTDGLAGRAFALLKAAAKVGIEGGDERITEGALRKASASLAPLIKNEVEE